MFPRIASIAAATLVITAIAAPAHAGQPVQNGVRLNGAKLNSTRLNGAELNGAHIHGDDLKEVETNG